MPPLQDHHRQLIRAAFRELSLCLTADAAADAPLAPAPSAAGGAQAEPPPSLADASAVAPVSTAAPAAPRADAFFRDLPWAGAPAATTLPAAGIGLSAAMMAAATRNALHTAARHAPAAPPPQNARSYFQSLPWHGPAAAIGERPLSRKSDRDPSA